jgi:hypothetical protein
MFDSASLPLILGTLLALGALSYVLLPLLNTAEETEAAVSRSAAKGVAQLANVVKEDGMAVAALREIEFDRATGKLSDKDYEELKVKYTKLALLELREQDDASYVRSAAQEGAAANEDPVEAAVRAVQARRPKCGTCGPRPESDSVYCSGCGSYLPGACGSCGATVKLPCARFCDSCGGALAAA